MQRPQSQSQHQSIGNMGKQDMDTRGFFPGAPGGGPGAPGGYPGGFTPPPLGPEGFPGEEGGGQQQAGAPQLPPPTFTPPKPSASLYAVDPGSIRGCLYKNVYIWQDNGESYWMYLTHVGRNSISGFRWYGYGSLGFWLYFGLDLRRIEQFSCYY